MAPPAADPAIRFAVGACSDPAGTILRWRAAGGGKALCRLLDGVPGEIAAACGLLPVRLLGDEVQQAPADGPSRPEASGPTPSRAVWEGVFDAFAVGGRGDGIARAVLEVCGAAQRPVFRVLGQRRGPGERPLADVLDEMEALAEWAGRVAGRPVREGALERAIRCENERRRLFRQLEERLAGEPGLFAACEYAAVARAGLLLPCALHMELLRAVLARPGRAAALSPRGPRVFLAGPAAPWALLRWLDASGAPLVGEDLAAGHRHYAGEAAEEGDPLVALARREHGAAAHRVRPTPGESAGTILARARACGAQAVVLVEGSAAGVAPIGAGEARVLERGIEVLRYRGAGPGGGVPGEDLGAVLAARRGGRSRGRPAGSGPAAPRRRGAGRRGGRGMSGTLAGRRPAGSPGPRESP